MTVLTRPKVLDEIKKGNIKISPFKPSNLGPASYDLALGNEFRVYEKGERNIVNIEDDYRKHMKKVKANALLLPPYGFAVGITKEKITLPENISAWLGGRSRFARLGIQIHMTAAFIQPGISNRQALEIFNNSPNTIRIPSGTKICQIVFERTEGKAKYSGKFKRQSAL
ncbi:MAG TPA: dCTP deaminase [Candidatus Nanoarchaeia archaeon]|nr:dCTP deaminase [Candidatus Nanoarchaeia archaeon]